MFTTVALFTIQASNPSGDDFAVLTFTVFSENITSTINTPEDPDNTDNISTGSPQDGSNDDDQVVESLPSDSETDSESGSQFLSLLGNNLLYIALFILVILTLALVVVLYGRTDPEPFSPEFKTKT